MDIQSLKRWHWVAIGLIVGMVVAWGRLMAISDRPVGGPEFITQAQFESELRMPKLMDRYPYITDIAIHPESKVDLVSFQKLDADTVKYYPHWFAAPRPYKPLQSGWSEAPAGYRVSDFLEGASPPAAYSMAWWETPTGAMTIWMGGGAVVIGGIWPFILNFLVGAGLGRKVKEEEYDLSRFKSEAVHEEEKELSEEDRKRLAELEAEMMAGLAGGGDHSETQAAEQPAVLRELSVEAVEDVPLGPHDDKDYAGEYYPVEKKTKHGFSLVELLIVIGIIALLLAILMPVLAQMRERAQKTKCASNLRQVGAGLEMYNQVNRHLPNDPGAAGLADAMKVLDIGGINICPMDQSGGYSYTMNSAFVGMPKSAGDPGEVLASESVARHDGRANVVFFDGHVDEK